MIQQNRLKGKFKGSYVKSRTTWLNKNTVGFIQQDHHVENFTALPKDINLKMVALSIVFLLDQIYLTLELHHINWLNKYLRKLLSPLTSSQYTVNSTK